jgi:hypothetical protein
VTPLPAQMMPVRPASVATTPWTPATAPATSVCQMLSAQEELSYFLLQASGTPHPTLCRCTGKQLPTDWPANLSEVFTCGCRSKLQQSASNFLSSVLLAAVLPCRAATSTVCPVHTCLLAYTACITQLARCRCYIVSNLLISAHGLQHCTYIHLSTCCFPCLYLQVL